MTKIEHIVKFLEQVAPSVYQEDYDNIGLIVGDPSKVIRGILISLDVTEAVLHEAKDNECNLIIAHHPVIFKPFYKLLGETYSERCIIQAIKDDIAIYVIHTNLDNSIYGVSYFLAKTIGLEDIRLLLPQKNATFQLTTFVPRNIANDVRKALHQAGAHFLNDDTTHSFTSTGISFFQSNEMSLKKSILKKSFKSEEMIEDKIEVVLPIHLEYEVLQALHHAHPYENVPYQMQRLVNSSTTVGSGVVGVLNFSLTSRYFLKYIKTKLSVSCIQHTAYLERPIKKVAVCGGSGSFLIEKSIAESADAFITSDLKYHDFFKADGKIIIVNIEHYDSEIGTKDLIYMLLSKNFNNIVLRRCETITNPVYHI